MFYNLKINRDLYECSRLLKEYGPEIFQKIDNNGNSVLHWACIFANMNIIALIVSGGEKTIISDININNVKNLNILSQNELKSHPIHWACDKGHVNIVEFFLKLGVDINIQDGKGYTPLMIAVQNHKSLLAIYLHSNGANTSIVDSYDDNCLHWAAYSGNL